MYLKQWKAVICIIKSALTAWVKWVHHSEGNSHCETCLALDGCFSERIMLRPVHIIRFAIALWKKLTMLMFWRILKPEVTIASLIRTYLTQPDGILMERIRCLHRGATPLRMQSGYKNQIERQGREKYISGDYSLGKLTKDGQRISIRIEIPRKDGTGTVSFISGWMVEPNGRLRLTTPYGGK